MQGIKTLLMAPVHVVMIDDAPLIQIQTKRNRKV